ncbi:MAG: 3-dehydroquinate synthase [Ardenticatenaceae bacterium]|nr:3-dehydroquinate synthase [Ardenticatenaceae bacterium]MCB8988255.1 3-dehydroquinate synthase [Ardenticatenaceae bacterium]
MKKQNIVLTGFMGTGKSTVGRLLAERLGYDFVDTDELIVERDGRSIADIFRESGELAFRQWEARVAQELSHAVGLVIATGGRMMVDEANAWALQKNGRVFCLTADPHTILARLDGDERRPLLNVSDPEAQIRLLLAARTAAYGRFPQIATDGRTPEQVTDEIMMFIQGGEAAVKTTRLPVTHPTGRYDIIVGENLLNQVRELAQIAGEFVVITDDRVGPLYAHRCAGATAVITVPSGEQYKTLDTVRTLYNELLQVGLDRQGTIVALGGGVVGDMAGFAAASFLRGVDFVQCPTTLLSMVDASVGGKTGVDLPQGKNLVGAFKQPTAVLADISTLYTLDPAEFASGMAEVVKHGLIASPALLKILETGDWRLAAPTPFASVNLQSLVLQAVQVKRDVVEEDPFEQGRRALLNLGHTFGHAIEQVSGYAVRHGEGVALGLVAAANLSARLEYCDPALQSRIEGILQRIGLPIRIPAEFAPEALYQAMWHDKKKAAGKLRFILLRDVADVFIDGDVAETAILATLHALKA